MIAAQAMPLAIGAAAAAVEIDIAVCGPHAQRFTARHGSARLAAVYTRSLHLQADGDFLCIGEAGIGNGPLNAVLQPGDWGRLEKGLPAAGSSTSIAQGSIRIGRALVRTATARTWRAAPWPRPAENALIATLEQLERIAQHRAPADGLARIALGMPLEERAGLGYLARPRIEWLRRWVAARLLAPIPSRPPVGLLGLGPGLTPSGDDLLCGVLVALHAIGRIDAAHELNGAIAQAAPAETCPLSSAFLHAAGEGLGAEPLHAAIAAVLDGDRATLTRHAEALGRIGHTSGWDALAGAVLVLQAFGTTGGHRPGVARFRITE
jgi:hypothetical protein